MKQKFNRMPVTVYRSCKVMCLAGTLLLLGLFSSCSDKEEISSLRTGTFVDVTMKVASFDQIPFDVAQNGTKVAVSPDGICSRISFAVYSGQGSNMTKKQVNQEAGSDGFGTASFRLEEGTYKVVVLAHSGDGNPTMTDPSRITFNNKNGLKVTDTFLYCEDVEISAQNHDIDLELERVVAKFQLHLEDESLPQELSQLKFEYSGGSSTLDAITGQGCVNSKQTETIDCTDGGNDYEVYTFVRSDSESLKIKVSALDSSGEVLKEQEFQDVPVTNNYITRYSGEMFSRAILNSAFSIVIDDVWGGTKDYSF